MARRIVPALIAALALILAGCGTAARQAKHTAAATTTPDSHGGHGRPQAVEPTAGVQAVAVTPTDPVGDPNAHAPSLSVVRREIKLELVYAPVSTAGYVNPLPYVTCCGHWERTDQGVDATMPVGAPIVAPSPVKILAVIPNWYAGQPLVYWELLNGPDAGKIQYVAEEITSIARPGTVLAQGQPIARFAAAGTGIEFGWSTPNGVTLAMATTGYEEGVITPAGASIRAWLNSLGANAGPNT
jgi:hypothetical protein